MKWDFPGTKRWVIIPAAAAALAGMIMFGGWRMGHQDAAALPDEKAAGVELLVKAQAGPGYFHAGSAEPGPFDEGGPWMGVGEARSQIQRVAEERKMDTARVDALIVRLAEPHPSRTIGGERIAVVRLNLALDAEAESAAPNH